MGFARRAALAYSCDRTPEGAMTATGLRHLAFGLLLALILYVAITGGA